jgi:diketogulonate reductase-like aldo/keto reductase
MNTPKVKLNNQTEIPQVGLGLWKIFLPWVAKKTVATGLTAGYRHFDCAQAYLNEQSLGSALKESTVSRKDVFITTKIWNGNQPVDKLAPSFANSLEKLKTDYVDLLLLHFPVTETRRAAWPEMEKLYESGQAKAIGVSNYMIPHLEELLKDCKVKPAVNQIELHVFLQQPELVKFCKDNDIVVEAYSPLAHGHGLDDPVLQEIAKAHGKTPAQIMLRWCIEIGTVPLPKSTSEERMKENLDIFDFKLSAADMTKLKTLNRNLRTAWDPTNVQ